MVTLNILIIFSDKSVDPEKGTGVLMVCSYGDKYDVEAITKRKLDPIVIIGSDGKIESARVALASVGPTPIFAKKASESLIGKEPGEAAFNEAGAIAKTECSPIEDMRGSIDQRRHLVDVLTVRTLNKSLERIGG